MANEINLQNETTDFNPFINIFQISNDPVFNLPNLDIFEETNLIFLERHLFSSYLNLITSGVNFINSNTITKNLRDDFLEINFETLHYRISNELYLAIHNNNKQISILPIGLLFPYPVLNGHSNIIIINPFKKTIEFFEPHGKDFGNSIENILNTTRIILKIVLDIFPEFNHYTIINSSQICINGPQYFQGKVDQKAGHCLAWSLLFIQLRLYYINQDSNFVVTSLSKINPVYLDSYIKRYITFLNSIISYKKVNVSYQKRYFRNLLTDDEKSLEELYISKLITEYFILLQKKIDIIDKDDSPDECELCKLLLFKNNHKYIYCIYNNEMLELNRKIKKIFESIHAYRNTPYFDETFFSDMKILLCNDTGSPISDSSISDSIFD